MFLSEVAATGGFFNLVPFIVFFPVIGMLINISFGSRMGELAIGWIASLASGLSFVISLMNQTVGWILADNTNTQPM